MDTDPSEELCLIDKRITSLRDVPLHSRLRSLNLHCNQIARLEGLARLPQLAHLDLSSNRLERIEGLASLPCLRTLNLSCNHLTSVQGLQGLVCMHWLNVSYNRITDLMGLRDLHGPDYQLSHLEAHGNRLADVDALVAALGGLHCLSTLVLRKDGQANPVCRVTGYRERVFEAVLSLQSLDGRDTLGTELSSSREGPRLAELRDLEDFLDVLDHCDDDRIVERGDSLSTEGPTAPCYRRHRATGQGDAANGSEAEPGTGGGASERRIEKLEEQISTLLRQVPNDAAASSSPARPRAKRDVDDTSESERDGSAGPCSGPARRGRVPSRRRPTETPRQRTATATATAGGGGGAQKLAKSRRQKGSSPGSDASVTAATSDSAAAAGVDRRANRGRPSIHLDPASTEESTYRALVRELDLERERRWKAEQATRELAERLRGLQAQAGQERELHGTALHVTNRLQQGLLKEREEKEKLRASLAELQRRAESSAQEAAAARQADQRQQKRLRSLEQNLEGLQAQRLQQQTAELKKTQAAEMRALAVQREAELLRASQRQQQDKVQQLQELLAAREQDHRKAIESRVPLDGPEFKQALDRERARVEERHAETLRVHQDKVEALTLQYAHLEDEFRAALSIEATRYQEVRLAFDRAAEELAQQTAELAATRDKERRSATLVRELTVMVKEQKGRLSELARARQEAGALIKRQAQALDGAAEEDKRRTVQLELLRKEKSHLVSQLKALESVADGLRSERHAWGHELAQQGAALSQDRGRMEARIESLQAEADSLRKQAERDADALKIKTKILDDQTETIRKLKEGLQERDETVRRARDESLAARREMESRLAEQTAAGRELQERAERLDDRKEQLELELEEARDRLGRATLEHEASNRKWSEKAQLLSRLEGQVRQMKEGFDAKEARLQQERDQAIKAHKAALDKLREADDAFRRQLESAHAALQAELARVSTDGQRQVEAANLSVQRVEEEMRALLRETASGKKSTEEKIRRLTAALTELQQEL
ncbi:leucine-rich repeat and coiled-coil domain-containing protein 1 [Lethenteron reissneri]|uniref:leucine-rich repeat and coiled-coil domain-containing protein 1 n=1 Tax=Lethenteron reissneri TaxID=7753 RepID=UPI002AB6A669|nr:leucine-rich repeat and coiled-coil domain-containing protein 1 [Lethenteron reissneri]